MKRWSLIDYLYMTKPIYMGLLFAIILFACKNNADMAKGVSRYDTSQAATPYGAVGPTTKPNRVMNSGDIKPGATYAHVFTKPGNYLYFCRYHGGPEGTGMAGTVHVNSQGTKGLSTEEGGKPTTVRVNITTYEYPNIDVNVGDTVIWTNSTAATHTIETVF